MGSLFSSADDEHEIHQPRERTPPWSPRKRRIGGKRQFSPTPTPPPPSNSEPSPSVPAASRFRPKDLAHAQSIVADLVGGDRFLRDRDEEKFLHDHLRTQEDLEDQFLKLDGRATERHTVNAAMHRILVDWLQAVHARFELRLETLHVAISLVVRFMVRAPSEFVCDANFQCLGVTALHIASKFEENNHTAPMVCDYRNITAQSSSCESILALERNVLHTLDFRVSGFPTAIPFLCWYGEDLTEAQRRDALFHVETALMFDDLTTAFLPSTLAAAATCMSLRGEWPDQLQAFSGYSRARLQPVMERMARSAETLEPMRDTLFLTYKFAKREAAAEEQEKTRRRRRRSRSGESHL